MAGSSASSWSKTALPLDSSFASKRPAGKVHSHFAQSLPFDYMIKCPEEIHRPRNTFSEWPPRTVSDSVQAAPPIDVMPADEEETSQLPNTPGEKPASTNIHSFNVHSCVLANFDMFRATVSAPPNQNHERVIFIPDYDSFVVDKLIEFMYDEWIDDIDLNTAAELIKLADCYRIPDLKELCGVILSSEAARKPVDMCVFAHTYEVKTLKLECERILTTHVPALPDAEIAKLLEKTSNEWSGMHTLGICCQKELLDRLECDNALQLFKLAYETDSSDLFEGVFQFFRSHWDEMLSSNPLDVKFLMEWNVSRTRLLGPSVFNVPGSEAQDTNDPREGNWVRVTGGGRDRRMPARAMRCGTTDNGTTVYVGRANYRNFVIPGYVLQNTLHYSFGGHEIEEDEDYEVLVAPLSGTRGYAWVRCNGNAIPPTAVYGGAQQQGERLFIGRRRLSGRNMLAGKVHPSHSCLYVGAGNRESRFVNFEILVRK